MPELLHPGVYVQEVPPVVRPIEGASTSTTAFIGVTDKGPLPGTKLSNGGIAQPLLVTSFTEYLRNFGGFRTDSFLTYAAQAFFSNGGRRLYVVRVAPAGAVAAAAGGAAAVVFPLAIEANSHGLSGNLISVEVAASSDGDATNFKIKVYYDQANNPAPIETFDRLTSESPPPPAPPNPNLTSTGPNPAEEARAVVNSRSEYIAITAPVAARPATTPPTQLAGGSDGAGAVDFIGQEAGQPAGQPGVDPRATGTGIHALDKVMDVSLIAIPGEGHADTINRAMAYCKLRPLSDCFFIGDVGAVASVADARFDGAEPDVDTVQSVGGFLNPGVGNPPVPISRSFGDYGAVYYPWVWANDPVGRGRNPRILLPPSGFVAGLYARIDNSRGVFKAPAGTEAGLAGVMSPARVVDDIEQDSLNPVGVNVIRPVPAGGIVVWGARTIGSDPGWRYIPVRRMAIFLRVSIYRGIQWAVFEPNDEPLWASLRANIRAFMLTQFRAGAFQGAKPDDAFFVLCDSSTTAQSDIDNGVVNILVGFAPLKPAEFVVLKLSQKVNQPASQ